MRFITTLLIAGSLLLTASRAQNQVYLPPDANNGTIPTAASVLSHPAKETNTQYTNLLGNLLWFYEAQRSGALPLDNRVLWRNSSLTDDGQAVSHVDLSGGYYDAGDTIKATLPLSWTLQSAAWGAAAFGQGYNLTGQAEYLDGMLRWGLDWMIKASETPNALWVFVGNMSADAAYWGGDQGIPQPRSAYQVTNTSPGTDVFAAASAAFAAASFLYNGGVLPVNGSSPKIGGGTSPLASLRNEAYATTLQSHAVTMWTLATTSMPMQLYQKVVPEVDQVYASTDYLDDLVLAGLWLAIATGNRTYSDQAVTYYTQMLNSSTQVALGKLGGVLNWDQKQPATAPLFVAAATLNSALGIDQNRFSADAEAYLDLVSSARLPHTYMTPASSNSSGLLWFTGDSEDNSLNPALNAAFLLQFYEGFCADPNKAAHYRDFADSQLDYTLGKNPMNAVYVVGQHPNSAQNPHSAFASGGSDIGSIDNDPPVEAHVLYGCVVGGPNSRNKYFDQRSDYVQTECALDYNAPMLSLIAARVQQQAFTAAPSKNVDPKNGGPYGDPVYVALAPGTRVNPTRDAQSRSGGGVTLAGQLAIGIIASLVFLAACGAAGWWNTKRIQYWLSVGAQPSKPVARMLDKAGLLPHGKFFSGVWKPLSALDGSKADPAQLKPNKHEKDVTGDSKLPSSASSLSASMGAESKKDGARLAQAA
ncbi:glycoside hydrolase family 9 protein [Tilletiaria anomala UBC 951]|uniref:Endoglucanase n=1 Tax=Tilletiaria anomala (strain ATCC 24038 / CBS 436.72 / UBC 951) TaxID=1037660 RepID=A0A066WNG5_TILAU|nr:glycoside hydrolase family 9 protein [Tilletiaria anomala UBC 951]KDN52544.1 glycoside hydrolase family 9 protein [Tilletiaria anomala UBC 951]